MPEFSDIHVVPCREKLGKKLGIGFPGGGTFNAWSSTGPIQGTRNEMGARPYTSRGRGEPR